MAPLRRVRERHEVGEIEADDGRARSAVVGRGDGAESFLAGRVPHLEAERHPEHVEPLHLEVHADGGLVVAVEHLVAESIHQRRLADARVSEHDRLGDLQRASDGRVAETGVLHARLEGAAVWRAARRRR